MRSIAPIFFIYWTNRPSRPRRLRAVASNFTAPMQTPAEQRQHQFDFILRPQASRSFRLFVLSGSFQCPRPVSEDHARMRRQCANIFFEGGYSVGSASARAPGLCIQPELCTPGRGARCLPSRIRVPAGIKQHKHRLDPCLSQMLRTW